MRTGRSVPAGAGPQVEWGNEHPPALSAAQPRQRQGGCAGGPAGRGVPRPRNGRAAGGARQGAAARAIGLAAAVGGGEPAFLPLVPPAGTAGPQRLPHLRQAHGTARVAVRVAPGPVILKAPRPVRSRHRIPRRARSSGRPAAPVLLACAALLCPLALGACGGAGNVADTVPKSTPDITPPTDTSAEKAAAQSASRSTSTTSSKKSSTGSTESSTGTESAKEGGAEAGGAGAAGGASPDSKEKE